MSALGTGISVQQTIIGGTLSKTWTHNVGRPALKVEVLTSERRPMADADWDIDNLANSLVVTNNAVGAETFIVWVTWEVDSTQLNGTPFEDDFV